jgi:glucuronoarabinoxylan endo-1,4-beta-xylanase
MIVHIKVIHIGPICYKGAVLATMISVLLLFCSKKNGTSGGNNPPPPAEAEISILASETHQVIEGFGAATVFRPPGSALNADELDRLFGKAAGQVGLNILRIRITEDATWRSYELTNSKGAIQRGAKVIATPWSPPARWKTNNNLIGGSLIADSGAAYAKYLNNFADYMSANGAPIYAVSVQNEPDIQVSYESCDWTSAQMKSFLKNFGQFVTSTKLIATESFNNNQSFTNDVLSDAAAATNVDIVGGHIYGGGIVENTVAANLGKEVWMTEHLDTNITYKDNLATAIEIHNCLTKANFSAYIWWYAKRFYGPIGEDGLTTKRGYMMSQFSRFIPVGSVRIGTGLNSSADVLVSAYITNGGKKIIIAINNFDGVVNQKFTFGGAVVMEMVPYTTSNNKNAEVGTKVAVTNNAFSFPLPALSVTTFVEQ